MARGEAYRKQQYSWDRLYAFLSHCLWTGNRAVCERQCPAGEGVCYGSNCRRHGIRKRKWTAEPYVSNEKVIREIGNEKENIYAGTEHLPSRDSMQQQ